MSEDNGVEVIVIEDYYTDKECVMLCLKDKREIRILKQNITLKDIHLLEYRYNSISFKGIIKRYQHLYYSIDFKIIIHKGGSVIFPE